MTRGRTPKVRFDMLELWSKAMLSPTGVQILCDDRRSATNLALRLNVTRQALRHESTLHLSLADPNYGRSQYDSFTVRKEEVVDHPPKWRVIIQPSTFSYTVEDYSPTGDVR